MKCTKIYLTRREKSDIIYSPFEVFCYKFGFPTATYTYNSLDVTSVMHGGMPTMRLSYMEKKQIDAQVAALLEEYGYNLGEDDYVNIVDFVQHLGFVVGNAKLDDEEDGFLAIQTSEMAKNGEGMSNDKIIGVNSRRSLDWKRFIIAHEFAHSVLHYKTGEIYLHRESKKGKDAEENEADYFAAALLMPEKSFVRLYNKFKNDGLSDTAIYLQLASIFKVPFDSVPRRVNEVV